MSSRPALPSSQAARDRPSPLWLPRLHGGYYVVSGVWPLVSPGTFQAVTGEKHDFWLAITVGLELAVVGVALLLAQRAHRVTRELAFVAAATALVMGIMDVVCVTRPRTTRSYLLDAPVEFVLAAAWAWTFRPRSPTVRR